MSCERSVSYCPIDPSFSLCLLFVLLLWIPPKRKRKKSFMASLREERHAIPIFLALLGLSTAAIGLAIEYVSRMLLDRTPLKLEHIHPFIHPSIHPFIHSFIHSFIHVSLDSRLTCVMIHSVMH
jgi:hypothetical protein